MSKANKEEFVKLAVKRSGARDTVQTRYNKVISPECLTIFSLKKQF